MIADWTLVRKNEGITSLSLLLPIVLSFANIACGENSMETIKRTLPAYAIAVNAERTLKSTACSRELSVFRDAVDIRKLWALRVLDSSGKPQSGFVNGNNFWLGSRAQCIDASNKNPFLVNLEFLRNASRFRKVEDEFPPYKLNYFVANFQHNSTLQYHVLTQNENLIALGLCLPASCTTDQLSSILEKVFRDRTLVIGDLYMTDFKLDNFKDLQDDGMWFLNSRMIIVATILAITLLLMIAGTAYDIFVYQKYLRVDRANSQSCTNNASNGQKLNTEIPESQSPVKIKHPSSFSEILHCFSIYTNTKTIFETKIRADTIGPINGLRVVAVTWIILIHVSYFTLDMTDNKATAWRLTEGFTSQVLTNGSIVVDNFFFISGFLMAHLYFKLNLNSTDKETTVNYKAKIGEFFRGLLKRFIRVTPAYMMTIGILEITSAWYNETSIFVTFEKPQESCAKYGWRNLLYIHNLYKLEDMCMSWSWYLSNDMQYYVVGSFIVILSSICFYTAATILVCILFSSMLLSGYLSYINGYVPTLDEMLRTVHIVYYAPWARIGPYIVGIVTAYILVRLNNKLTLRRRNIVVLWILGIACNFVALFAIWERQISVISTAIYVVFNHTVWGIGIAWLLIACCTNNGGIINKILSHKGLLPLSRLSYCAYLVNPLIIRSIHLHRESPIRSDTITIATTFLGTLVATFLCSYVLSLMMEMPYLLIVRLFTKPRTRDNSSKQ